MVGTGNEFETESFRFINGLGRSIYSIGFSSVKVTVKARVHTRVGLGSTRTLFRNVETNRLKPTFYNKRYYIVSKKAFLKEEKSILK